MKVAFPLGGTDWGKSGIGIYTRAVLRHLSTQLAERGDVLIVLGSPSELAAYDEVLDGARRVPVPELCDEPALGAAWYLARCGAAAARERADVLLMPAANRRLTLTSPVPTVAVVHDLAQLKVAKKYDALRMTYLRHVVLRALKRADRLVAVSGATQRDLADALHIDPERIRVVPNGVDADRFEPASEDDPRVLHARRETGLDGPFVLYAARLEHPGKNHVRLVRAFARSGLRNTHRLVLPGGDWGAKPVIEEEIERLGVADAVHLLGYVEDEVLDGLVAGADVVAMVGLHEGFGLPALEALSAARPVVASTTGALPEVVGPLGCLCDPYDEADVARALETAAFDEDHRRRVAEEGHAWAEARGWDKTARGLVEACEAVVRR